MTKTEIYNKMKQAYYTLDIEAVQARIWAHHALNDWIEGITTDWVEIAERKETESQGVFNAMTHILPNWVNYDIDDDTMALVDKLSELKAELKQLTTLEEVA
ncbi:MAG: hypothetical protein ACPH0A_08150 [Candidatus Poseidoniaceae archaeon]